MECVSSTYKGVGFTRRTTHDKTCAGAECPFFQSAHDAAVAVRRTSERLCALPWERKIYIADKYHGGRMPWKE